MGNNDAISISMSYMWKISINVSENITINLSNFHIIAIDYIMVNRFNGRN